VHIDGTPERQLLLTITVFSHVFCTSAFYHPPSCLGINSPPLFTPIFGAHRVPRSKTTLPMTPRRMSQHLHSDEGPLRESINNPPIHQPSTQSLLTIAEDPKHPTFGDIPKVQLHQPTRDGNGLDSGRVDRKLDPRKNIVELNLTPEPEHAGEIWHPNPNPLGFGLGSGARRVL
jgi:hypothetical protein